MAGSIIVGGGPSGLAAAREMGKHGMPAIVLERLEQVGGLCRTIHHDGCLFDIGPHRFFTKNDEVHRLFLDVVAEDLVRVQRLTRIFYRKKFFNYPLTPLNASLGVGLASCAAIIGSYGVAKLRRRVAPRQPANFQEWVTDQFGSRLFEMFFQTYTEKVWGIPCTQIGADWAAQRIKGLSLGSAIINALFKRQQKTIKTLVDEFVYPRLGAGQFYEKMAAQLVDDGSQVLTGRRVVSIRREGMRVRSVVVSCGDGTTEEIEGDHFLFSTPLTETVEMMDPAPPDDVLAAARLLRYRNHVGVSMRIDGSPFPDNWIYVHSKEVRLARIANYANFSHDTMDSEGHNPVTVEYFCFEDDPVWTSSDDEMIALATTELHRMKLIAPEQVISGFVVRSRKAYPVIEIGCQDHVETMKRWLDGFENLLPIGRSGMFKYNNQDHAIATGLLAARTVCGVGQYDPWLVNIDAEYHEGGEAR